MNSPDNPINPHLKILYIGGDVRSGTTIIDMLLGMNAHTLAIGEVNIIFRQLRKIDNPVKCSCGKTLHDCELWSQVMERFHTAFPAMTLEQADTITRKVETYPERLRDASRYWDDYVQIWRVMFAAIAEISGASVIIDSSKTGRHSLCRPLSLAQAEFDVSLLQMMRDPRAVTWSKLRREIDKGRLNGKSAIFRAAFMSGLHWSITNASTTWQYGGGKKLPYYEMRYRDFMDHPAAKLQDIQQHFGLDFSRSIEIVETDGEIDSAHLASGNELRFQSPLRLRPQPPTWKTALPRPAKVGVLVSAPIAHFYGYHVSDYHTP
ncbi:MAG: hypothetical protein GC204_07480 [Chloroflexi bacterium]|nr:hypothetical protein [Chloroflexota bacterium]